MFIEDTKSGCRLGNEFRVIWGKNGNKGKRVNNELEILRMF